MIKKYLVILSFTFFTYEVDCQPSGTEDLVDQGFIIENQKYQLSIYALASNPEKYDGKKVFVTGYAKFFFGFYLYPDKSSCEDNFNENSLMVSIVKKEHEEKISQIKNCSILRISGKYKKINSYGKDTFNPLSIGKIREVDGIYDW